jgi:hypothetical protein
MHVAGLTHLLAIMPSVMSTMDPNSQTFPAECPDCHELAGVVRVARTVPNERHTINLTVRCLSCTNEWVIPKPLEVVVAHPGVS